MLIFHIVVVDEPVGFFDNFINNFLGNFFGDFGLGSSGSFRDAINELAEAAAEE